MIKDQSNKCLALTQIILDYSPDLTLHWKYKVPFFYFKGKPFCYIHQDKKTTLPYVAFVKSIAIERPELALGNRKKIKALTIDPSQTIKKTLIYDIWKSLSRISIDTPPYLSSPFRVMFWC